MANSARRMLRDHRKSGMSSRDFIEGMTPKNVGSALSSGREGLPPKVTSMKVTPKVTPWETPKRKQLFYDQRKKASEAYRQALTSGRYNYSQCCQICLKEEDTVGLECGHSMCKICARKLMFLYQEQNAKETRCPFIGCQHLISSLEIAKFQYPLLNRAFERLGKQQ